jgi:hypothetical protein
MASFVHVRRQHGVGQGGFHSAFVEAKIDGQTYRYDYVYDCGALENANPTLALERSLEAYRPRRSGTRKHTLDALVLSHYDKDHMNGAEKIANFCDVRKIFLPYLSPENLALEIARQAEFITVEHLNNLFGAAHEATLWGHPIVRIVRGPARRIDMPPVITDIDPDRTPPARENTDDIPHPLIAVDALTNVPVDDTLDHVHSVRLSGAGVQIWQLKFWNQEVDELLSFHTMFMLARIGFPIDALDKIGGATTIASWLSVTTNRDLAVDAYKQAIEDFTGSKLVGHSNSGFANYISLAMFSGPVGVPSVEYENNLDEFSEIRFARRFFAIRWNEQAGWLGTGDAMLGESEVWRDFSSHFSSELDKICTVLLPHHGAAPRTGAKFYNRALNTAPGIFSVLSYGKNNREGHPTTEVVDGILIGKGIFTSVTEDTLTGFVEIIRSH